MRNNARNVGLREWVVTEEHRREMGPARFLYEWLTTRQTDGDGWVLGGKPLTYREISADLGGSSERTLKRWMARLRSGKYIQVWHTDGFKLRLRILGQQKFTAQQLALFERCGNVVPILRKSCGKAVNNPISGRPKVAHR